MSRWKKKDAAIRVSLRQAVAFGQANPITSGEQTKIRDLPTLHDRLNSVQAKSAFRNTVLFKAETTYGREVPELDFKKMVPLRQNVLPDCTCISMCVGHDKLIAVRCKNMPKKV